MIILDEEDRKYCRYLSEEIQKLKGSYSPEEIESIIDIHFQLRVLEEDAEHLVVKQVSGAVGC